MYILILCNNMITNKIGGTWYESCGLKYRASITKFLNLLTLSFLKSPLRNGCFSPPHFPETESFLFASWLRFVWPRLPTPIKTELQLRLDGLLETPREVVSGPKPGLLTNPALAELVPSFPGHPFSSCLRRL